MTFVCVYLYVAGCVMTIYCTIQFSEVENMKVRMTSHLFAAVIWPGLAAAMVFAAARGLVLRWRKL